MNKILHVIDVSPHIYAGAVNKKATFEGPLENGPEGWSQKHIPVGGISFLFNKVYKYARKDAMAFCFDRTPTNRLNILPTYKGNRKDNPIIDTQREIAEEILTDCGFHVYGEEGYEADDILYTLVKDNKDKYDHIYVHTGDSDLYTLVDDNVSIEPSSSRSKTVIRENYETTVSKNRIVNYNGLNLLKWIEGDYGDGIPKLTDSREIDILSDMYHNKSLQGGMLADPELMRYHAEARGGQVLQNFLLVYPWYVEGVEVDPHKLPDIMKMQAWGKAIGNSLFRTAKVQMPHVDEMIEEFFKRGMSI